MIGLDTLLLLVMDTKLRSSRFYEDYRAIRPMCDAQQEPGFTTSGPQIQWNTGGCVKPLCTYEKITRRIFIMLLKSSGENFKQHDYS